MKNILVPIDFSNVGARSTELAATLAAPLGAKVWLIHVAAPDPDFVGFKVGPSYIREHLAEVLKQEHSDLQQLAAGLRERGVDAEGLMVQGPTAETLFEMIDKLEADMVVMGSHGRGALYKAFVGSVSQQILAESRVPVLIVPSPDRP